MQPYIPKAESESAPIDASRAPNWRKWKYVHDIVLWRAVALSLNIAPEKVRRNPRRWRGRFAESEEFLDRLFVAEHNLQELQPLNFAAMHYDDADPVVRLKRFAAWAISIGWSLPRELTELGSGTIGTSPSASTAESESNPTERVSSKPESPLPAPAPGLVTRRKRSGPIPTADKIRQAGKTLIVAGHVPLETIFWARFQEKLCAELGVKPKSRGYSIDTIRKALRPILEQGQLDRLAAASTESAES